MSSDKFDQWLDDVLAEEMYLDDDGFTESVMARLPQTQLSERRIRTWNWLAGTLATAVVAAFFPWAQVTGVVTGLSTETWMIIATATGALFTAAAIGGGVWSERAPV
ncbi:hypothetical protein QWI17_02305 [Gilvimarinus sp. SDUM040013]|uniref:Uncharacterized protein n=1 Tax=Gilvimarinus gilvus TaxID=3058038 RepID=A0ABU4RZQ9_9GAMM|nr:hypothetical protein [Gilvimarinus sp. SDUM040013]MDO3384664.1 hypothetical protein [Gilvimarinus sp. SDUM040013]MDX6850250.1 hypothetical protein [Gilvimarinus sp. SDUM040013]